MSFTSNSSSFIARNAKIPDKLEKKFSIKLTAIAKFAHRSLLDKTPVYEGRTVRNYILTMGNAHQGGELDPIGTGPTGETNRMPLGSEPRRPANERASLATQSALDLKNPFKDVFITNTSRGVGGLERGELPGGGKTSRSPSGMFAITMEEVVARINSGAL